MPATDLVCRLPVADTFLAPFLEANGILPLEIAGGKLRIAVAGEPPADVLDDLAFEYDAPVELVPVSLDELREAIGRVFAAAHSTVELVRELDAELGAEAAPDEEALADVRNLLDQPPVVRYVNSLIKDAAAAGASDIHVEATRDGLRARLRVDGVLGPGPHPPKGLQAAVVSRIKLLAGLDIAERRLPQDGRIRVRLPAPEGELALRVSTVPSLHGESVVLRLLDRGERPIGLGELGMDEALGERFKAIVSRPHGIVLATGPTGSGKTTTLYAALGSRRPDEEKIVTVEDPVEYHLAGVTQVPVTPKAGLTWAAALRSIVRQDFNVLLVGEMRDPETAAIATQAALTGHLVLATLHTGDAAGAIPRLMDLGVEPYLVASTLEAVLAQRLVRKVCEHCRRKYRPAPQVVALVAGAPVGEPTLVRGEGCRACRETGYRGRTGIFELVVVTDALRDEIAKKPSAARLRELARAEGLATLREDGWAKVQAGLTTIEEVLRVTDR